MRRELKIPHLYVQLIDQFWSESVHPANDKQLEDPNSRKNKGHEALRRSGYVRDILQLLGRELKTYRGNDGGKNFRSKVLNPILMRYLWGVPDSYTPSVREGIAAFAKSFLKATGLAGAKARKKDGKSVLTITDATIFYLSVDPLDPDYIPHYRRNLVYVPEPRWHLVTLADPNKFGDIETFNDVRHHHDYVMEAVRRERKKAPPLRDDEDVAPPSQDDEDTAPPPQGNDNTTSNEDDDASGVEPLSRAELEIIMAEDLEDFYVHEMTVQVSKFLRSLRLLLLTIDLPGRFGERNHGRLGGYNP